MTPATRRAIAEELCRQASAIEAMAKDANDMCWHVGDDSRPRLYAVGDALDGVAARLRRRAARLRRG